MGLDLTISNKKIRHYRSTGVFIRENGRNVELKSIDDVKKYFPFSDISHIKENEYITNEVCHLHITHNLNEMAQHVISMDKYSLYELLWRPSEINFNYVNQSYIKNINSCLDELIKHKNDLIKYNPDNGWGSYETLLNFVNELYDSIKDLDLVSDEYLISASI